MNQNEASSGTKHRLEEGDETISKCTTKLDTSSMLLNGIVGERGDFNPRIQAKSLSSLPIATSFSIMFSLGI